MLKINFDVENVYGLGGLNSKETWQTGGKICLKIYASRMIPNPGKRTRQQHRLWKLTWLLKILVVFVSKQQERGELGAKFEWKIMFLEFNENNEKLKFNDRNFKNYLACRKYWWFWGQNNKKGGLTWGKFGWTLIRPEFNQIKRKVQGDKREYGN